MVRKFDRRFLIFCPQITLLCDCNQGLTRPAASLMVRFAPESGQIADVAVCPIRTKRRHWLAYSITSSARSRKRIIPFRRLLWCSTCVIVGSTSVVNDMASDEEVGRQILSIFMQHKVGASGVLRRNHFIDVRDADFQRGLNKAVENRWIKIKLRDRYTYELTEAGLAAGLGAGLPPGPLG